MPDSFQARIQLDRPIITMQRFFRFTRGLKRITLEIPGPLQLRIQIESLVITLYRFFRVAKRSKQIGFIEQWLYKAGVQLDSSIITPQRLFHFAERSKRYALVAPDLGKMRVQINSPSHRALLQTNRRPHGHRHAWHLQTARAPYMQVFQAWLLFESSGLLLCGITPPAAFPCRPGIV